MSDTLLVVLAILYYLLLDRKVLQLLRQPLIQSLFIASLAVLCVLWQLQATLPGLPAIHFIGITALVLLLGLRLTLLVIPLALALPVLASVLLLKTAWPLATPYIAQWCALVLVAIQSYLVYLCAERWLARHLFVRIFVCGFFNAMLGAAVFMGSLALLQLTWSDAAAQQHLGDYLLTIPLLAMPEALLNGMALTLLLVYRPQWLAAFRQE